jgi:hypothetical protein
VETKPQRTAEMRPSSAGPTSERAQARPARLQRPGELWGRRSVAIGAVLVAAALIGGLVLLFAGGGDDSASTKSSPHVSRLQDRFLKHTVVQANKGISVRRPGNWSDSKDAGAITLRSHDRCLAMTLAAPQDAGKAKGLRDDSIAVLRHSFGSAKVNPAPNAQIGDIPTKSVALSFADPKGGPTRVLLGVGTGDKYAYLTEVVVRDPSCQGDLQLAQVVLSSIQYTK